MRFLFLSVLLLLSGARALTQVTYNSVLARVKAIQAEPGMTNGTLGFCLMDPATNQVLVDHFASQSLLPASTLKTVTTAAALGMLGENFRFKTAVEYTGTVNTGTLTGDLIIRGGGDPSLGSDRFEGNLTLDDLLRQWAQKVKEKGITRIEGRVIGDEEIFETQSVPETWVWQDMGNYYGAGPSGLTVLENTYYLYFKPAARVGDPAELLRCEPPMTSVEFVNEMKTGGPGSGDNGYIYGGPYTYLRYLRGSIPQGKPEFSIKGSIPDPALYCAEKMTDCLREAGIEVMVPPSSSREEIKNNRWKKTERSLILTHESPPLKDIVFWINKKSVNLFAEHLLKYMGYHKSGKGSTEAGAEAVRNYFSMKGIDVRGLHLLDGSGLSRYNGITPAQLAGIIGLQTKQTHWEAFWNSLPIAGDPEDVGSIKDMCVNTVAAKNVRAKSGYIMRVRTYAGFVQTRSGKRLSFAMMPNNFTMSNAEMKKRLEDLMVMLAQLE